MAVILLILVYVISSQAGKMAAVNNVPSTGKKRPVVVIDAGHGGNDPGKIGIDGSLEKDINLQIAMKLKKYLEASDVEVVLTRDNDNGLYSVKDNRKKMADMTKRCEIINKTRPALTVSIHQNSYHQEEISGGQVFYYKKSEKGKKLAEIIQDRFDFLLGEKNTRLAKPNDNYYLLLHVRTPIVIVECGFLTNKKESALLNTEDYQDRVAWTIHMGIMRYLNER
ncbi:N-acetylmuramoyl-L-alanine amidase [Lacrimispora amygdalina]|nr:N-acetylmuramoyl-L-alanine amidase [uncultured Clostridium sp.]